MIEDRRAEGVDSRDWPFYSTGKAFIFDLRNSLIDLVPSHLAFRFVANACAADTGLNEILNHFRRKKCGEDSASRSAEQ